jgi:hypothetical protein
MRRMGSEATAEDEQEKNRKKNDEERKKMDEERKKDEDEDYERKRKEDERRADRRREIMAEEDAAARRDLTSRRVLVPPAPRQSHYDDPSSTLAASAPSVAALIAQAIDRPLRDNQILNADDPGMLHRILFSSGPYRRLPDQSFDTHNPAMNRSVYPDSGYSSMIMNDPQPIVDGRGNGNGVDYDRAAQSAPGPTTGSGDRSRSGGPGSGPDFFGKDNIGSRGIPVDSSRGFDPREGQGSGENAEYYSGKYQERTRADKAPDLMGAMRNRLNDDAKRRGRGQGPRSQDEEYGGRSRSAGGPDFGDAYPRNVDRSNGDGNYYRERSRGDYQDGGRRNLKRSPSRRRAGQDYEEEYYRRRNHADDYDEERRHGRSRTGGSRYDDDEYGVDGRHGTTNRHRTEREERDAYNQRRGLGNHARDDEGNPLNLNYDRNGRHGPDGQLAGAVIGAGAAGGTTIINNVLGGFPMTAGVVSSSDPAPAGHTSISEPAPEPIQPETVIEEKPTEKVEPVRTEREQKEKENQARRDRWVLANEQRDRNYREGRRKGHADAGSASQKAEVSNGYTQPEELAAETVTEGSKPRDDGTGMGVSSGSRGSGDSSLKPSDLSDDRDLPRKDKGQPSDRQGTATPTVSSHTVTGQGSESQDDERSRVDSAMGISPSQTKSSGDRLDEIPLPGSAMANSSIPPEDSDPQSGKTGYGRDETNGEQSPVSPKTTTRKQQDSIPSPASPKDSANSLGYDDRNSQIQRPESASPDKKSLIMSQGENFGDGAKREPGVIEKGTQRSSFKAKLAEISPVTASKDQYPSHRLSTSASLLEEPDDHVGMKSTRSHQARTGRKQPLAEERIRGTTKHAMQAQSSVLKRHNVTGPKTFGRLIKLALKSSPKMAFLSSVVMVIYLIGAVYLGNQVANILQVTAPSSRLSRRQSPRPSSSATSAAADPETSTFSSSTFESFDEDTQMLILINVWHAISWLVLVSLAHYIWENIPDPDGPRTRKNWLDKFGLWSMLRVLVTVAPMSVYLLLGARQLTSCAYLLNDPDAIAWSMGPDVGLTWNYLSENNGRSGSTPATVDAPVQDMGDWQLLLISIFFWLTGIPVLLYSIKRVQYPGSLSRGKIIRKVENRYGPYV